jgi:hypothetical membrane protein
VRAKLRHSIGPFLWALCFQYFVAEAIAAHGFRGAYSLSSNYISDLGAQLCGAEVCSPLHRLMNASFILQGLLIFVGSLFVRRNFRRNFGTEAGFLLLAVSGLALAAVGVATEDINPVVHYSGASAHFLCGGAGMMVLGTALRRRPRTATIGNVSLLGGILTLVASILCWRGVYFGLGVGGMERVAAYPYTVWLVGMGIGMLTARKRAVQSAAVTA